MPEKRTLRRARRDKRQGKAATTQAGEFVREEMEHVKRGKHGAKSRKQAIAIGLSKARRSGVKLKAPKRASARTRRSAQRAYRKGQRKGGRISGYKTNPRRSAAAKRAVGKTRRSRKSRA